MELLFATVIALGIGFIVSYLAPGRDTYGSVLVPALSASVTAAVWVALVWAGWAFDATWIWVVSLLAGGIAALAIVLILPLKRRESDEAMQQQLVKQR